MTENTINRINELARKAKSIGLTDEEIIERDHLRKEYVAAFRKNLVTQLENTYIVDETGNKHPLSKKQNNK